MLTTAQLQALAALVATDSAMAAALAAGQDQAVADWLNAPTADYYVWRASVPPEEYREAITWTEVDSLTVGKARIWEWLTGIGTLPIEPSKAGVRAGIADAFGAPTATRAALLTLAKRLASRAEQALATGTGSTASPGTMGWEGPIAPAEVSYLRTV
jgi:hypothetical protein